MEDRVPRLPIAGKPVKNEDVPIFTSDPATFLVATAVMSRVRESVSEIRKWLEARPDLVMVLDTVLANMKKAGLIEIFGDRIVIVSETLTFNMSEPKVAASIYSVMEIVIQRAHVNVVNHGAKSYPDGIAWAALPDHPKVRRRIAEIYTQFKVEVNKLVEETKKDPEITGDQVRFVAIFNGPMCPEDF